MYRYCLWYGGFVKQLKQVEKTIMLQLQHARREWWLLLSIEIIPHLKVVIVVHVHSMLNSSKYAIGAIYISGHNQNCNFKKTIAKKMLQHYSPTFLLQYLLLERCSCCQNVFLCDPLHIYNKLNKFSFYQSSIPLIFSPLSICVTLRIQNVFYLC